jgi:hypothetical protein
LQALNDPRGQTRLLAQKLELWPDLQQQFQQVNASVTEIQQKVARVDTQLTEFANLAAAMQTQQSLKEQHQAAYQEYLAYRELANTRNERQKQLEEATHQLQTLKQEAAQVQQEHDRLTQSFDPVHFQSVQTTYQQAKVQQVALSARLPDMQKYLDSLDEQLARLKTIQAKRSQAKSTLEQKRKLKSSSSLPVRRTKRLVLALPNATFKPFPEKLIICFENCLTGPTSAWNGHGTTKLWCRRGPIPVGLLIYLVASKCVQPWPSGWHS